MLVAPAGVQYASGYRSVGGAVHGTASIAAVVTGDELLLAGPVADAAPAAESGLPLDDFVGYGRFYFEAADGTPPPATGPGEHATLAQALTVALRRLGLDSATVGLDHVPGIEELSGTVSAALPRLRWASAASWMDVTRANKLPAEVDLLERAAHLAEAGILDALENAAPGVTERDLAKVVGKQTEEARVAVRAARRDAMDMVKDAEKDKQITEDERKNGEKKIQELTDKYIASIDEIAKNKEKEIMEL